MPPEWLFVGLGNPGPEYAHTRHNVGFDVIDLLASRHRIKVGIAKHQSVYGIGMMEGTAVALVKPLTFMNLSGRAVAPMAKSFGIPPERIVVIADDLDLVMGRVRLKPKGSSGGHNGHKSLIQHLGTEDYPRLKLGIGRRGDAAFGHVRAKFHPDGRVDAERMIARAADGCEAILREGLERAISTVNGKSADPEN